MSGVLRGQYLILRFRVHVDSLREVAESIFGHGYRRERGHNGAWLVIRKLSNVKMNVDWLVGCDANCVVD